MPYIYQTDFREIFKEFTKKARAKELPYLDKGTYFKLHEFAYSKQITILKIAQDPCFITITWGRVNVYISSANPKVYDFFYHKLRDAMIDEFKITVDDNTLPTLTHTNTTANYNFLFDDKNNYKKEEKNTMMNFNFDFGPINKGNVQMSPYGLAIMNSDKFYAFNNENGAVVDVTGFTFDLDGMIYKMPVAANAIQIGDCIMHQGKPMFVTGINSENRLIAVDVRASEEKIVIPVSNLFGFNFVTKITSLMNFQNMAPSADQPFGNIMPLMMMQAFSNDDSDMGKMLMMSMMMGGNNPFAGMFGN